MFPSRPQARAGARAIGWLSIAIGAVALLAPRQVARVAGMPGHTTTLRACGVREIATGAALLGSEQPARWMWARVAGDLLDAALLTRELRGDDPHAARAALLVVGVRAVADLALAQRLSQSAPVAPVDYKGRSGFPLPAARMRGAARSDFTAPPDLRVPAALRPWDGELPSEAASTRRDARR